MTRRPEPGLLRSVRPPSFRGSILDPRRLVQSGSSLRIERESVSLRFDALASRAMAGRFERVRRKLLGDEPRKVLLFVAPTCLAILLDVCLRARSLVVFPPKQWLNYFGSSLASAGFWGGPLWLASRLFLARGRAARAGLILFSASFIAPLAVFCFGGQPLYYQVFQAYIARDTVRLGIALRGTLGAWLASWGASLLIMIAIGLVAAAGILALARVAAKPVKSAWPIVPIVGFITAATCFWFGLRRVAIPSSRSARHLLHPRCHARHP